MGVAYRRRVKVRLGYFIGVGRVGQFWLVL